MAQSRISQATRELIAAAWWPMLAKIEAGEQVGQTIKAAGFSREMLRAYLASTPNARKEWDEAREASADAFFDQVQDLASGNFEGDPKAARVQFQALTWLASRRNPRVYSEKTQIDLNVRSVDLTAIIADANRRLAAAQARALPGEVIRDSLPVLVPAALADLM